MDTRGTYAATLAIKVVFIVCSFIGFGQCHESYAFAFELPDSEKSCFYQTFEGSQSMILEFEVIRGGNRDVDIVLKSPNEVELYKDQKATSGEFEFETSYGTYSFCFSNEFSTYTHKVIYFELRPITHENLALEAGKKLPTADTQFEHSLNRVHDYNSIVADFQTDYRVRESTGQHIASTLNDRVQWWSLAQSLVIILVGFVQVMLLKTFFSKTHPNTLAKMNMMRP